MITAIMQPYFFPYIGYFQLMHAVDAFIVYDDAQFMKGGWINRNRILLNGEAHWWTYALKHAHYTLPINGREYAGEKAADRVHAQLANAYRRAPYYDDVHAWIHEFWPDDLNVAASNEAILRAVAAKLDLSCRIFRASQTPLGEVRGEERVLRLCEAHRATTYVNAAGGQSLYDRNRFRARGIELEFLAPRLPIYPQFGSTSLPGLSIVDALMFCGFDGVAEAVRNYGYAAHG